jgi:hypothetical protein
MKSLALHNPLMRLLTSAILIVVGLPIAILIFIKQSGYSPLVNLWVDGILWFLSGTAVGAGVFRPFKFPKVGALIGFAVQAVIFVFWLLLLLSVRQLNQRST